MPFSYNNIVPLYNSSDAVITANIATHTSFTANIILELRQDIDYLGELTQITGTNWTSYHFNWTKGSSTSLSGYRIWLSYITDLRTACEELYTKQGLGSPTWTVATANLKGLYDNADAVINQTDYTKRTVSLINDVRTAILAVADSVWLFCDSVNGNDTTGDGTFANPYQTWDKIIGVINTNGSGNAYFQNGSYTGGSVTLTTANVTIRGHQRGKVIFNTGANALISTGADYVTIENISFVSGQKCLFFVTNATFNYCTFNSGDGWRIQNGTPITFNHCVFFATTAKTYVLELKSTGTVTINDCIFYNDGGTYAINFPTGSTGTVTENNCSFYGMTTQHGGTVPTIVQNSCITTNPLFDTTNMYVADTSPCIGVATDSTDIGTFQDPYYNAIRDTSDLVTVTDPLDINVGISVTDTVHPFEALDEVNPVIDMNLTVNMFLGGIFFTDIDGTLSYYDKNTISKKPTYATYNGASLDLSFDNPGGDQHKLYIAVDDGTTNYNDVGWWAINATYPAVSSTGTSFIDAWKECTGGLEWGESYTYETVTADGVNDQKASITLKVRAKNFITGEWSELVTVSKEYFFNDFAKSMYYCADNPRVVNGEYANHSNYYAQTYHTGTDKYVRPDGVNWSSDSRRFVYNPMVKAENLLGVTRHIDGTPIFSDCYTVWKDRKLYYSEGFDSYALNETYSDFMLYACIFSNFGNWNYNSAHCFSDSTTIAYDSGDATLTNPVFTTGKGHYIKFSPLINEICEYHSSHASVVFKFPSTENVAWGDYCGDYQSIGINDFTFQLENPYGCGTLHTFKIKTSPYAFDGYARYIMTRQEYHVNCDANGDLAYGHIQQRAYTTTTGGVGVINHNW